MFSTRVSENFMQLDRVAFCCVLCSLRITWAPRPSATSSLWMSLCSLYTFPKHSFLKVRLRCRQIKLGPERVAFLSRGSKDRKQSMGPSFYGVLQCTTRDVRGTNWVSLRRYFSLGCVHRQEAGWFVLRGGTRMKSLAKPLLALARAWLPAQGYLCTIYGTMETELSAWTVTEPTGWIYPRLSAVNQVHCK